MPIRILPNVVYGTFKARQRKYKVDESGEHYVKDENGNRIPDGWEYYTMHAVWANCLCAFIYKYRDKETGEKMYTFNYEFFNDAAHARRCFKGGWGENIVSARFNIATKEGLQLAKLFIEGGIKVTPYNKPLKKGKKK
jgi:hypothetical protein